MASKVVLNSFRRRPKQLRARQTFEAVLDAVIRLLKQDASQVITTNRIAEVAGVSIGSLYQYFPDKRAILTALHQRHIDQIDHMVHRKLVEHAESSIEKFLGAMVEAMIEAHASEPELYEVLRAEVPDRAGGSRDFADRLHGVFRIAISSRAAELKKVRNLDRAVFVVTHMIEALSHGAVLRRPASMSLKDAKNETVQAILAYLRA